MCLILSTQGQLSLRFLPSAGWEMNIARGKERRGKQDERERQTQKWQGQELEKRRELVD